MSDTVEEIQATFAELVRAAINVLQFDSEYNLGKLDTAIVNLSNLASSGKLKVADGTEYSLCHHCVKLYNPIPIPLDEVVKAVDGLEADYSLGDKHAAGYCAGLEKALEVIRSFRESITCKGATREEALANLQDSLEEAMVNANVKQVEVLLLDVEAPPAVKKKR